MYKALLLVVLLLSGCATSQQITGPNGTPAFLISCGSGVIEQCYEKAAETCPNGYHFLDKSGNPNAVLLPAGNSVVAVRGRNKMFIECK